MSIQLNINTPVLERSLQIQSGIKIVRDNKISWMESIPFIGFHLFTLAAIFFVDFSWSLVGLAVASYYLRMFAITGGYHRYFAHRTYGLGRVSRFLMAFLGCTATQKGPLWWASHHRHHHRYSDLPEDIHSPKQEGFWKSHVLWILTREHHETRWPLIKDLSRFPELVFLNKFHVLPAIAYAVTLFLVGGWNALFWGYFFSTIFLWHGTFTINSLCHVWGSRTYHTTDTSRNNLFLAIITMGEGWHNNHHCYMNSANQGFRWWQIDPSFYIIKALSWVGITKNIKIAPVKELESKRI